MTKTRRRPVRRMTVLMILALVAPVVALVQSAAPAAAIGGNQRLVVVLCRFTDSPAPPHIRQYYEQMFNETGAGQKGSFDYWRDVSYGQLDLTGTVVTGWHTVNKTMAEYKALSRAGRIDTCASMADPVTDFSQFAGVGVVVDYTDAGADLLFGAPGPWTINRTGYSLGAFFAQQSQPMTGILHETGHSLGLEHSRTVSQQMSGSTTQSDYGDPYDVMSCNGCFGTPSYQGDGGPGLNAPQLDSAGWLAADRQLRFNNDVCRQQTIQMAALSEAGATGYLAARIPAIISIVHATEATSTIDYWVEYRDRNRWDAGIPFDTMLIHLRGFDGRSYWVDQSGLVGNYYNNSREYADPARKAWVALNATDPANHTATVTLGSCKLSPQLSVGSPATAVFGASTVLEATLTAAPGAPVSNKVIRLTLGDDSCQARTNQTGRGVCSVTVTTPPGSATTGASFAGDEMWSAASATKPVTVERQSTRITYTGATSSDYSDAFTASATLVGETSGLPLGSEQVSIALGATDTCTGITSALGEMSCSIVPTVRPGQHTIVASFAGSRYYRASSVEASFTVTKEQTALRIDGPARVANDTPATLSSTLVDDDPTPVAGRPVTLAIGTGASEQSCTGTTAIDGQTSCTIAKVSQPASATDVTITARFAGDDYYLASEASASARLLYYTGRATALTAKVLGLDRAPVSDTGEVTTSAKSDTSKSAASAPGPGFSGKGLTSRVTTGLAKSTAEAAATDVTIGVAGLPVVRATNVRSTSTSVCSLDDGSASASGTSTIGTLTIGGVTRATASIGPNSVIDVGLLKVIVNEQVPVAGASAGLQINALHILGPNTDIVVASSRSDIHNC